MAGLWTVVPDALPPLGGEAVAVPLAALAATLVASLLVGLCLSRAQSAGRLAARVRSLAAPAKTARRAGTSQDAVALVLRGAGEHAHGREAA